MRMRRIRRGGLIRWGWRESETQLRGIVAIKSLMQRSGRNTLTRRSNVSVIYVTHRGSPFRITITSERRRVDTVVIEDGKAQTFEVTSPTADKTKQLRKETKIRAEGGAFIRNRETREIVPVSGISEIVRIP